MKKVIPIIIIVLILLIAILSNNIQNLDSIYEEQKEIVIKDTKDLSNITEKQIKNSIEEIKNNYLDIKDQEILKKVIYNVTYLEFLTDKTNDKKISELVDYTKEYINTKSKESKEQLSNYLKEISEELDKLTKELYINYNTMVTLDRILSSNTKDVTSDLNDPNMISKDQIRKAIDYIEMYYQEPYKNDEVIDKITYYSLYLSGLTNKQNNITNLGIATLNYLQSLKEDDKKEIEKYLSSIKDNKEEQISSLYKEISN